MSEEEEEEEEEDIIICFGSFKSEIKVRAPRLRDRGQGAEIAK